MLFNYERGRPHILLTLLKTDPSFLKTTMMKMKKQTNLLLDKDLHDKFGVYCKKEGYTRTGLIRKLIINELTGKIC